MITIAIHNENYGERENKKEIMILEEGRGGSVTYAVIREENV